MMKRAVLIVAWAAAACMAQAQQRVVVADAVTREPVERASLYAKEGGRFRAAISDEQGVAQVSFAFRRLTVSHLNYESQQLRSLPDTIWLKPRYRVTAEVVVTNKEPAWIGEKLREVVRTKQQRYFSRRDTLPMRYRTTSLDQRSMYRYDLTGWLRTLGRDDKLYAMAVDSSIVSASDSTTLTDVANLRRMLYEDFVAELDRGFISGHRWAEDPDYEGRSRGEVELVFRSKHRTDDRGRLVLDTARCVILQAYRFTGTETNRHERVPKVLYAMAQMLTGYKIEKWSRHYRVKYGERSDGTLYARAVEYKMYMETNDHDEDPEQQDYTQQTGGGFPNMEATLEVGEATKDVPHGLDAPPMYVLPRPWYVRYATEGGRQEEVTLSHLPMKFVTTDDTD